MATEDALMEPSESFARTCEPSAIVMNGSVASLQSEAIKVLPREISRELPGLSFPVAVSLGLLPENQRGRAELVQFAAIRDPRLRVVKAIPVSITLEDGHMIASWSQINEFGMGLTLTDALENFGSGVRDLYNELFLSSVRLGPDLLAVKEVLGEYIQQRK